MFKTVRRVFGGLALIALLSLSVQKGNLLDYRQYKKDSPTMFYASNIATLIHYCIFNPDDLLNGEFNPANKKNLKYLF